MGAAGHRRPRGRTGTERHTTHKSERAEWMDRYHKGLRRPRPRPRGAQHMADPFEAMITRTTRERPRLPAALIACGALLAVAALGGPGSNAFASVFG